MATTNHYDLIVVGTDLAGLVAAALVARRGKRVLLLPQGPADGRYRLGRRGFDLDTAPLIHLGCPAAQRVFEELGLWTQIRRELRPLAGLQHWALDGHRLDAAPNTEAWGRETAREWPGDPIAEAWTKRERWSEATDALLDDLLGSDNALVADGFWGRRFLARVAKELPPDDLDELEPLGPGHPVRAQARAIEPWLQQLDPRQLGKAASLRLARAWERGPLDRGGGAAAIREQLLQRFELKSGEVKPNLRLAEILHKRGKVTGISLLGKRDRYGCDHMLIATDPRALLDGPLVLATLPKPLQVSLANLDDVARRYLLHVDIDERGLGPGLDGPVISVAPDSPLGVGHTYLRAYPGPREGQRQLALVRIVGPDESIDDMREQILDELDRRGILPFARPWIELLHSPHDGREATDGRGQRITGLGADTAMRQPMTPLLRLSGANPGLGVGLLPHSSGIKHLHFASRLTYPGLGVEGEFVAGWAAAGAVVGAGRSGLGRNLFLGRS